MVYNLTTKKQFNIPFRCESFSNKKFLKVHSRVWKTVSDKQLNGYILQHWLKVHLVFNQQQHFFVISAQKAKKPPRAKEKPQLRVPKGAKMSKSSISKDDFKWVPSSGEKIRSKGYSNFAPNDGNFKLQSVTKMDYTSISTHNSPFKRKPRHNLTV